MRREVALQLAVLRHRVRERIGEIGAVEPRRDRFTPVREQEPTTRHVGRDRDEDSIGDRLRQELVQSDLERRRGRGRLHPDHAPIRRRLQHRRPRANARLLHRAGALDAAPLELLVEPHLGLGPPLRRRPHRHSVRRRLRIVHSRSSLQPRERRYGAAHRTIV